LEAEAGAAEAAASAPFRLSFPAIQLTRAQEAEAARERQQDSLEESALQEECAELGPSIS